MLELGLPLLARQLLQACLSRRTWGILAALLLSLSLAALSLEFGLWKRTETYRGPFPTETKESRLVILPIAASVRPRSLLGPLGDSIERGPVSDLRLSVDGQEWKEAHVPHDRLRAGFTGGFSHWNNHLFFWLPPERPNDETTSISISYSVHAHYHVILGLVLLAIAACAGLLIVGRRTDRPRLERASEGAVDLAFSALWIGSLGICLIAMGYAGTIIWGLTRGDALPTATIIRTWPTLEHVWDLVPFASHAMFALAAVGCILEWVLSATTRARAQYNRHQHLMTSFWTWAGWPVLSLLLLFLLSGGGWSGRYTPLEMHYMSLGGLLPYSDARVYYTAPFESIYEGAWNAIAGQRPFAAAARSVVTLLGAYSYTGSLIFQALLVALAIAFCARSVARSYGMWIALAFTGLAIGLARPFLATMMTESLGLIWALIALAFFLRCFRLGSVHFAFLGYAALCIGLLTRMGSMFSIFAIPVWIVLRFGDTLRQRLYLLGTAGIIFAVVLGISFLLSFSLASNAGDVGGNFSYTICGLSRGTGWGECANTFASQIAALDRNAQNALLWKEALNAIRTQPSILLYSLYANITAYLEYIPRFFIVQYVGLFWPSAATVQTILLMLLPGWLYFVSRRDRLQETSFFLILLASVVLSAALVYRDDGGRTLIVTHVFVAVMIALGLSNPMMPAAKAHMSEASWRMAAAGLSAILAALVIVPVGASLFLGSAEKQIAAQQDRSPESSHLVLPSPALTGFLVQSDHTPLRHDIASIHQSTLEAIFRQTRIENDLGPFIADIIDRVPTALVYAPRIDVPNSYSFYIAPADVLRTEEVKVWKLELNDRSKNNPLPVHIVRRAVPLR